MVRLRPVPQDSDSRLGIAVFKQGVLTDADSEPTLTITRVGDPDEEIVTSAASIRDDVGLYSYAMEYEHTQQVAVLQVDWEYDLELVTRTFSEKWRVYGPMFYWNQLSDTEKILVEEIYSRVANTFDSTEGGPYLWEVIQSHFNPFEIIAECIGRAVDWVNYYGQPMLTFTWGFNTGNPFPAHHSGILQRATYIEFLKHLSRSYIEIPEVPGMTTVRLDRRRYRDEWLKEAENEKRELEPLIKQFKRAFLFRNRSLLVGGGAFPAKLFSAARPAWLYYPVMW